MKNTRRSRGVALITALLITALTGSLAAGLAWDNALDVRRTMVLLFHEQGTQVALGAESWIRNILRDDAIDSSTDHLGELWASDLPGLPVDNDSVQGAVIGKVEDLQGRFNVNNLIDQNGELDEDVFKQFERLLRALDLDPKFAGITADWIDANQDTSFPDGAEDPIYTGFFPPYKTPNQPLTSVSELAAIEGMDRLIFRQLVPHIAALPGRSSVNVNTATPAVLQSLSEDMTVSDVEGLVSEREGSGFGDIQKTFSTLVTPEVLNSLVDSTAYFRLKVVVRIDRVRVTLYSTLQRGPQGDVTPILRSIGST